LKSSSSSKPFSFGSKSVKNAIGAVAAGATIGAVAAGLYTLDEQKAMQNERMAFEKKLQDEQIKEMKNKTSSASHHSHRMTEIKETATDDYTKQCAHCSGQLAEFFEKYQLLSNAVCKEEYEKMMDLANSLVGIAKSIIEDWANNMYDPVQNLCIPDEMVPLEAIIEKTKGPLISQFGGCDWKCGTGREFHQMMYENYCSHEYDNEEYRNIHQTVTCN